MLQKGRLVGTVRSVAAVAAVGLQHPVDDLLFVGRAIVTFVTGFGTVGLQQVSACRGVRVVAGEAVSSLQRRMHVLP